MTLLGKIFTFLILLMSIVFMSFALVVYQTQTVWRDEVMRTSDDVQAGEQVGYKEQLEQAQAETERVKAELAENKRQLELEIAARQLALAANEAQLQEALALVAGLETEIAQHQEALREKVNDFAIQQQNLQVLNTEIEELRVSLREALEDRNGRVEEVVALSNQINQLLGMRRRLEERETQLIAQVGRMKSVLDYLGADEHMSIPPGPPEDLEGVVLAVNDRNLVEISVGTDDGLREGHYMEVYRGTTYVGRLIIRRSEPDKAVGEFLQEWRRSPIQRGDTVAAKVS